MFVGWFFFLNFSLSSLITSPRTRRAPPRPRRGALGSGAAAGPQVRAGSAEGAAQGGGGGEGGVGERVCGEESLLVAGKESYHVCVVARACHFGFFPPKSM